MEGLLRKQTVAGDLEELVFCGTGALERLQLVALHQTVSVHGIRFSVDDGDRSVMSIIGVYLPCLDQGLDCYRDHLVELERVVSESELLGPVIVLGDFNAHLGGYLGAGASEPNVQGVLLQEVMERLQLSAVSLGSLASGPGYTY